MGSRRKSRECALQMLFQWDITHDPIDQVAATYWEGQDEPEETRSFADALASGSVEHVERLDALISRHAENWRLDRMAIVDRNILRLAAYEFLYDAATPRNVVINEAVEIARRFSSLEAPQFVNGVLDSISRELNPQGEQ